MFTISLNTPPKLRVEIKLYRAEGDIIMNDTLTEIETENRVICSNIHLFFILWHNFLFTLGGGGFYIIFNEARRFGSRLCLRLQAKQARNAVDFSLRTYITEPCKVKHKSFEVLTVLFLRIQSFRNLTLRRWVSSSGRFEGSPCLQVQSKSVKEH